MISKEHKIFGAVYYTFFANGFTALITSIIMPFLIEEYQIGYDVAGLLLSVMSTGALAATFLSSFLAFRYGLKLCIVLLSACVGFGYLGFILFSSVPALIAFSLLIGITRGSISNINNYIVNNKSYGTPKYLNILHTFYAMGAFLSPLVMSLLLGVTDSWRRSVALTLAVSVSLPIVYGMIPISTYKTDISKKKAEGTVGISSVFIVSCIFLFLYVGAENAMNGWLVTYLKKNALLSQAFSGILLSVMWLVMMCGRILCAKLSDYVSKEHLVQICSIGASAVFLLFLLTKSNILLAAAVVLTGLFLAPLYPSLISLCGNYLRTDVRAMGLFLSIGGLGKIALPYAVGIIAKHFGMGVGMYFIFFALVMTALLALISGKLAAERKS